MSNALICSTSPALRHYGGGVPGHTVQRVRPAVQRMLDAMTDQAAFVLGRRTDILATNHLARALLADFNAMPHPERNLTRWVILDPAAHALYLGWETVAPEITEMLRLDAGRHPDDPQTAELVGELAMKSDRFRRWWADHRVVERTWGAKRLRHPVVGDLTINYEALTLPGEPDQTLFVYLPAEDAWRLLASWHAQPHRPTTGRRASGTQVTEQPSTSHPAPGAMQ